VFEENLISMIEWESKIKIIALYSLQLLLLVGRIGFWCGWSVVFAAVVENC